MGEPQSIIAPLNRSAIFLVATVGEGGTAGARDLLADLADYVKAVGFRVPAAALTCVAGIGSRAWDRLFDGPRPAGLHPFQELHGDRHHAPATPGDLLFHITADAADACFELAMKIADELDGVGEIVDQTVGFRYFEQRDLLGFADGTANPVGPAAARSALVGAADPDFSGGSYVIVQKYLHDLRDWNSLSVEEQEQVIGRTKMTDFELVHKQPDSHVESATVIGPDGVEHDILRANMPFGSVADGEFGTYFIGYAADPEITETMLRRMFLGTDDSTHDRILDFSTAVTGSLFFAPSADFLADLPGPPAPVAAATSAPPEPAPATDGSLGIGSLRQEYRS